MIEEKIDRLTASIEALTERIVSMSVKLDDPPSDAAPEPAPELKPEPQVETQAEPQAKPQAEPQAVTHDDVIPYVKTLSSKDRNKAKEIVKRYGERVTAVKAEDLPSLLADIKAAIGD